MKRCKNYRLQAEKEDIYIDFIIEDDEYPHYSKCKSLCISSNTLFDLKNFSPLFNYIFDIAKKFSDTFYIDYKDWQELIDKGKFKEEDMDVLKEEIKNNNLSDYFTIDDENYKISGTGVFILFFKDDSEFEKNKGFEK